MTMAVPVPAAAARRAGAMSAHRRGDRHETKVCQVSAPGLGRFGGAPQGYSPKSGASQGWGTRKRACQGCDHHEKRERQRKHAGREKCSPGLHNSPKAWPTWPYLGVVMRFRWPKQRIGGLNKASLTRAQPAPNHFEAHKNGAKRASQQLACLAPATTAAGTEPSEASRPRRGRFALQRNPEGGVPLHCNRLRL